MEKVLRQRPWKRKFTLEGTSMKNKFSIMILTLGLMVCPLSSSAAYAITENGVTCVLFDSMNDPGAIHWPVNGNLYYCGNTPSSDAAGVSVVWNYAEGATQRVV